MVGWDQNEDQTLRQGLFVRFFVNLEAKKTQIFFKTQHFGGMIKILCDISWVLLIKTWKKKLKFTYKNKKF